MIMNNNVHQKNKPFLNLFKHYSHWGTNMVKMVITDFLKH